MTDWGRGSEALRRNAEAKAEADKIAPLPRCPPLAAGLLGGWFVSVILMIFLGISGLPDALFASLVVIAIGFAAPFFLFRHLEMKHYDELWRQYALADEKAKLAEEED